MLYIAHRINTIQDLKNTPQELGVEVDLRDQKDRLILSHDPFAEGDDFEEYLQHFRHKHIILNIKSERIEFRVRELLEKHAIREYFFLDSSFPMIYNLSEEGENNLAVRFSEFEGIATVMAMKGKARWVWIDCFTELPVNQDIHLTLKNSGFKLCLVSPDLHGRSHDIVKYKVLLEKQDIQFDAICTKIENIDLWKK